MQFKKLKHIKNKSLEKKSILFNINTLSVRLFLVLRQLPPEHYSGTKDLILLKEHGIEFDSLNIKPKLCVIPRVYSANDLAAQELWGSPWRQTKPTIRAAQ